MGACRESAGGAVVICFLLESYAILAEMADRLTTDMEFDFLRR